MAGGTYVEVSSHDSLEGEPWSVKQKSKSNTKSKTRWGREKESLHSNAFVYPKEPSDGEKYCANGLDKADFLIDGLLYSAPNRGWCFAGWKVTAPIFISLVRMQIQPHECSSTR